MTINGYDSRENGPDDSFGTSWSGQASVVGEVTSGVDGLDEVTQVNVAGSLCIWILDALNTLSSKLDFYKFWKNSKFNVESTYY
jgi:hypothetical protein